MNIIEPNNTFDFSKLSLVQPLPVQGGTYFTKILYDGKALYIQTPKCTTRQGFLKNNKKIHCDVMFDNNCDEFVQWVENLEICCQKFIFGKSGEWFQNNLEMSDIETAFNSPLKIYKSGKYYLLRANVNIQTITNAPLIKIYNESETPVPMEEITNESSILSILEIKGIKFTTRNFQIEIEMKQVMVLNKENIFDSCLIKKSENGQRDSLENAFNKTHTMEDEEDLQAVDAIISEPKYSDQNTTSDQPLPTSHDNAPTLDLENDPVDLEQIVNDTILEEGLELKEFQPKFDLETAESLETIKLKSPNEFYYEIYKEAREKAKEAKKKAIVAYLEAKNLKKTYLLENLDSSSDDGSIGTFSDED